MNYEQEGALIKLQFGLRPEDESTDEFLGGMRPAELRVISYVDEDYRRGAVSTNAQSRGRLTLIQGGRSAVEPWSPAGSGMGAWRAISHLFTTCFPPSSPVWYAIDTTNWTIDFEYLLGSAGLTAEDLIVAEVARELFLTDGRIDFVSTFLYISPAKCMRICEAMMLLRDPCYEPPDCDKRSVS